MELKKLTKVSKIFDRIKELDKEIIELDKLAMDAVNDKMNIELNLTIENLSKKEDQENKVTIDSDGSLNFGGSSEGLEGMYRRMMGFSLGLQEQTKKNTTELKNKLTSKDFLLILKVLLDSKNEERNSLFNQLSNLGVRF